MASRDVASQRYHLPKLFKQLQQYGLILNVHKSKFGQASLDFLGNRISHADTLPLPERVNAITQFSQPITVKGLQKFAGMVKFYRRLIPHAAQIMVPSSEALKSKQKALV